jgi:hypothetical protein
MGVDKWIINSDKHTCQVGILFYKSSLIDLIESHYGFHDLQHVNPHETRVTKFQRRYSVIVWWVVLGKRLIGPFDFHNIITGKKYEDFKRNELPGLLEVVPLILRS